VQERRAQGRGSDPERVRLHLKEIGDLCSHAAPALLATVCRGPYFRHGGPGWRSPGGAGEAAEVT